ncbi:ABC transporter permease [Caenimonas sedimenti]|uniref:ABC transporter permease n=1 Tax=Caenimonas sedimenti TaxID=2596921 RepID=A0A562ZWP8_9BURK|nr:ABC transporter permease [Caenimonas sedimenti]TWO73049.1 ABC transporter permease [Caenimonas sedimenti]
MKTLALSLRYLAARPLAAALNLLLLTLGLASITFVVVVSDQVTRSFQRDLAGIDLVVGAKGSPMQLILAGVFHIDVPPGNIALADVKALAAKPQVAQLIPLSLGDSFGGFRIVGTTPDYIAHYQARLAAGVLWKQSMEAVAGAQVAQAAGLQPGAAFQGSHGLGAGGHTHGDTPYRIVGVLAPCGCVLDRLILTATESVWQVHEKALATDASDRKALEEAREVTMALVRYKSPLAAASFPRYVNNETDMQAAAPAIEITRLLRMLGVGSEVLQGVGAVLLLTAALSVFIALWTAVRERRADLAMLRMLGASPGKVAALVLAEAFWLAAIASVLGLLGGHALAAAVGTVLAAQQSLPLSGWQWVAAEAWIPVAALATAGAAALIPAYSAYRVEVAQLLQTR